MDEILIGDKKYVSSKQAAKATGYAKDYIGQLCREGRVPARLVGRSWYVLESAIHDHRFGEQTAPTEAPAAPTAVFSSAWESPRYEASTAEVLPSVNRLRGDSDESGTVEPNDASPQHLQDSWRAWFDRVANTEPVSLASLTEPKEAESEKGANIAEEIAEEEEVNIPIRTVYDLPPEDLLPRHTVEARLGDEPSDNEDEEVYIQKGKGSRGAIALLQVVGTVLAMVVATVAVIGTGYFDKYIISNSQVGLIAGVALYNK